MLSRRDLLRSSALAAAGACVPAWARGPGVISPEDLAFLRELAKDTVAAATVAPGEKGNTCGFPIVTPGGNYPALWIRDFSMACGCGVVSDAAMRDHLWLIASTQNGPEERRLKSGGIVPPFAIADHVNFDGKPVFYPGTYDSGEKQGGEPWGVLPPVDDPNEFVNIAHALWKSSGSAGFLKEAVQGRALWERLVLALGVPTVDAATGMVTTDAARRAVGFGFCDTVYLTGSMLFASLLRYRALGQMLAMGQALGHKHPEWAASRNLLAKHLPRTFGVPDGWLIAATGVGRQPDVWGTLFALHLGVLEGWSKARALAVVVSKAYVAGTLASQGAVRHVPTDRDFSPSSAWERTAGVALDTYQNGAYWHVPTGWLAKALAQVDPKLARGAVDAMVAHFRAEDWRTHGRTGAPWECLGKGSYRQNAVYMASVTVPLEVLSAR